MKPKLLSILLFVLLVVAGTSSARADGYWQVSYSSEITSWNEEGGEASTNSDWNCNSGGGGVSCSANCGAYDLNEMADAEIGRSVSVTYTWVGDARTADVYFDTYVTCSADSEVYGGTYDTSEMVIADSGSFCAGGGSGEWQYGSMGTNGTDTEDSYGSAGYDVNPMTYYGEWDYMADVDERFDAYSAYVDGDYAAAHPAYERTVVPPSQNSVGFSFSAMCRTYANVVGMGNSYGISYGTANFGTSWSVDIHE